jgi:hypothetical protein
MYGPLAPGRRNTFTSCGSDWPQTAETLAMTIISENEANERCCVACGELAMFIRVIERYNSDYEVVPLQERLRMLRDTETYKSLLEMGRRRGGLYALELIQRELRSALATS